MTSKVCIYHNEDLDGKCSAAILNWTFPGIKLVGADYESKPTLPMGEVYVVDYSFEGMFPCIWIDHHKTAIEQYGPKPGLQRIGIGACQLVWEYLYPSTDVPKFIKLLAQYDVWDHSNPDCLPFQYGMQSVYNEPASKIWLNLLKGYVPTYDEIIERGRAIWDYKEQGRKHAQKLIHRLTFEGFDCAAINQGTNSLIFEGIPAEIYVSYVFNGSKWKVSLYSDKVDVGEIAKRYGGGGHKGAAGFYCEVLPW